MEDNLIATTNYFQALNQGVLQFGLANSTLDTAQPFDFPTPITSYEHQVAVILQRTLPRSKDTLPAVVTSLTQYTVDRADTISGSQPFAYMALSPTGKTEFSAITVTDSTGKAVATIQWGTGLSYVDGAQDIYFPKPFSKAPLAVLTNWAHAGAARQLGVTRVDKTRLTVDRHDDVDGQYPFFWVAIGDVTPNDKGAFTIPFGNFVIKGGKAVSNSDNLQWFRYADMGLTDFPTENLGTFLTRTELNASTTMPVTLLTPIGFTIERIADLDGPREFYWVSIGR